LLRDLELDGTLRLFLHDDDTGGDPIPVTEVAHPHFDEIACPELAVDGQIEEGKIPNAVRDLQPYSDRPDFLEFERGPLADELALVPWLAVRRRSIELVHDWVLSSKKGATVCTLRDGRDSTHCCR